MWLHYSLFASLIFSYFADYFSHGKLSRILNGIIFILLLIIVSIRDFNIGNDTIEYYRIFNIIQQIDDIGTIYDVFRYEPGFLIYNYMVSRISENFNFFLFISSFIYLYSCFRFINKYIVDKIFGIILFFTFAMYYDLFVTLRQCLAISIFLFSIDFLIERKIIKFFATIFFASMFHSSAILLAALYFLPTFDIDNKKHICIYGGVLLASYIIFILFFNKILSFFPWFHHYATDSIYSEGGIRSASILFCSLRISILILLMFLGGMHFDKNSSRIKNSLFTWFILLECMISICSISFNMIDRLENFICLGYIAAVLNYSNLLSIRNRFIFKFILIIITMTIISIFLEYRSNWFGIFPYQSIFIQSL